jgi:hypothetical protein
MLAAASRSGQRGRYAEALSPYSDLAHQGGGVMDPLPNSGTPARLGVAQPNVTNLIVGGVTGRIVGSEPMQGYLGNQLLAGPLNAMGRTRPGMVARALMLPAEMSDTVNGR